MANKLNLHTMFYGTMVICGKIYSIICLRELPFIVDVRWGPRASYFDPLPLENSYLLNYTFLSYKILYFPQSYAPLHAYKISAKSIFFVRPTLAVLAWNDPETKILLGGYSTNGYWTVRRVVEWWLPGRRNVCYRVGGPGRWAEKRG